MEALTGGSNDISAENGNININGNLYGLHANGETSNNRVSVKNGITSITGGIAGGVVAGNGGKNEIIGEGSSTINIVGASGLISSGKGVLNTPSSNLVTNIGGKINISGDTGAALSATSNGSNYVVGKDVDLLGKTAGVFASTGSINEVTAIGGTLSIKGKNGVEAAQGGRNDISAENGTIIIEGSTLGVQANGGKNEIIGEGNTNITITGGFEGMSSDGLGANNAALSSNGKVSIIGQQGNALSATNQSSNYVLGKDVDISGADTGVFASGGSINEITGNGGIVKIQGGISGMESFTGGSNDVSATKGSINIAGDVYGVYADGNSSHNRVAIEDGNINITGNNVSGLAASNGGKNEIIGEGNSTITINGSSGLVSSGKAPLGDPSSNSVSNTNGKINIYASQGAAVSAINNGSNYVIGKDIDLFGATAGVIASNGSLNQITSSGTLNITGANGVEANGPGSYNDIEAKNLNITATSIGMKNDGGTNDITVEQNATFNINGTQMAAGIYTASGHQQITANGQVLFNVTSTQDNAYGIYGSASVSAGSVSMTIKGDLSALIMNGGGNITANTINLTAQSDNNASGMIAKAGMVNTIQSHAGQALDLILQTIQGGGKGTAMSADAGTNIITGYSQNGGNGDNIAIHGNLIAQNGGKNTIITGSGDDRIVINGDINRDGNANSQNTISSGDGNDTIVINGTIAGTGALYIDGGSGYNTLVLQAGSVEEFISRYSAWLNSLDSNILKGIQSIEFSGVDINDLLTHPDLAAFMQYASDNSILVTGVAGFAMQANDSFVDSMDEIPSEEVTQTAHPSHLSRMMEFEEDDSHETNHLDTASLNDSYHEQTGENLLAFSKILIVTAC